MTQIRSNNLNNLKVAHEVFTWNGRKYHVVGRYGGHKWHEYWLKYLDAWEVFPLDTRFRLARFIWNKHKDEPVQQNSHKRHIVNIIRLYTVFLVVQKLNTRYYLDLRETKYANQILASSMYFFINGCKAYDARA